MSRKVNELTHFELFAHSEVRMGQSVGPLRLVTRILPLLHRKEEEMRPDYNGCLRKTGN